jgi:hypothetical protein
MNQAGRPAAAPATEQRVMKERREIIELVVLIVESYHAKA